MSIKFLNFDMTWNIPSNIMLPGLFGLPRKTLTLSSCCRIQKFSRLIIVFICIISIIAFFISAILSRHDRSTRSTNIQNELQLMYPALFSDENSEKENQQNSYNCRRPTLDPWDPSIREYIKPALPPLECKKLQPELTWLNDQGVIRINLTSLHAAGYNMTDITCHYRWDRG